MRKYFADIHPDVLRLGLVSFLTDVSSEAIFSIFAVFFTVFAGASASLLGIIEGLADFSASSLDYLSGWLADRLGERKSLTILGYGFSTLAKLTLLFANSVTALASFRIVERLGKSFRGPPRDAWLAEVAEGPVRGYAFGVHKALDKAGAVLGPLFAYAVLRYMGENLAAFRTIFISASLSAVAAVGVLFVMKDRPGKPHKREGMLESWLTLSPEFKRFLLPAGIFALAYFSFGFLLLKAYRVGFSASDVVLLYALFNISFVIASVPIGRLGDMIGRRSIISLGYITYALMSLGFIFATVKWQIVALFLLFGIFYAIDEGQSKAYIADLEGERRATAIGIYNFFTGIIYLPASAIAGGLWLINPVYSFAFAALIAGAALAVFLVRS